MPKPSTIPITPEVLAWAIEESGFSDEAIAENVGVPVEILGAWMSGTAQPGLTQFKKLATKLHRPLATFLLPKPPKRAPVQIQLRDLGGREGRPLNPTERRFIRRARRIQDVLAWVTSELKQEPTPLIEYQLNDSAEEAGTKYRSLLSVTVKEQQQWPTASKAFDHWRDAAESLGIIVFLFPLTDKSSRGFSLWHERAPVVAVNTAWREEARIFTLFHEIGHLATRSNSACTEWGGEAENATRPSDPAERWCERFSASVLLPADAVLEQIRGERVRDLSVPLQVAARFKVSLRAATIRLIELGVAGWDLYKEIAPSSDSKPDDGGGGNGRNRLEARSDEFGPRGTGLFVDAVTNDVLSRTQAVDYLNIPEQAFDQLVHSRR